MENHAINGGAYWTTTTTEDASAQYVYNNRKKNFDYRALLHSENVFQSDEGFRLTIECMTGNTGSILGHNFSFGLISTDTDPSTYAGLNPFGAEANVYSLGVNITSKLGEDKKGLNFTNLGTITNLDVSGTNSQFLENTPTEVVLEIRKDGAWSYTINGVEEATGTIAEGFDLSKSYYVAVYGQDDDGGGKSITNASLQSCFNTTCVDLFDPFEEIEAEDYCEGYGVQTKEHEQEVQTFYIDDLHHHDYVSFQGVDFGTTSAQSFSMCYFCETEQNAVALKTGSEDGTLLETITFNKTEVNKTWDTLSVNIDEVVGIQGLYLVFQGTGDFLCQLNWIKFSEETITNTQNDALAHELEGVVLYPNPTTSQIKIQHAAGGTFVLLDQSGNTLKSSIVLGDDYTIPLDGLATGLYLLTLEKEGYSKSFKVFVQ